MCLSQVSPENIINAFHPNTETKRDNIKTENVLIFAATSQKFPFQSKVNKTAPASFKKQRLAV